MSRPILGITHSAVDFAVPAGACDCHTHVFGPNFPFSPTRTYTPGDALVEDLFAHQMHLGLDRVVIVHPSPYGPDNRASLFGMKALGPARARGVAVIAPDTPLSELKTMHEAGMRGIRLNLQTAGQHDPAIARAQLLHAAGQVKPLGWHIQLFTNLAVIAALAEDIRALDLPVVIDHMGSARAELGPDQPHFATLLALIREGHCHVKLSAPHRISATPGYADAAAIAQALIAQNPDRLLWGSDWPHPGGSSRAHPDPTTIEPFFPEDDGAGLNRLAQWARQDPGLLRAILVTNPARLYDF